MDNLMGMEVRLTPTGPPSDAAQVRLILKSGKKMEGTVNLCKHHRVSDWYETVKTIRLYNCVVDGHKDKVAFIEKDSVEYCVPIKEKIMSLTEVVEPDKKPSSVEWTKLNG